MKKLYFFVILVFIASLIFYSCNKDENPVNTQTGGGGGVTPTLIWKSLKKTDLNININPGITEDTLNAVITDFPADNYIKNINVTLDSIINVDASKLKFELLHQGRTVRVIDTLNFGGPGNYFARTVLSDSSSDPIRLATPPFTGMYMPFSPLRALRDSLVNGLYTLRIINSGSFRTGVIKSWGITVTYSPMRSNYCLEFNGTNQYGRVSSSTSINNILTSKTFTIEGWYKVLGYTYNYFSFLDKQSSWYFEYSKADTAWTFVVPGSSPTAMAKMPITLDTWYHIAVTYDGSTVKFYSNGQLIGSVSKNYNFTINTSPLYIACGISGAIEYGFGRYDEIRIWNVTRTASEIQSDYNKTLTGNENGLVLYYKFNEGSGSVIFDATANGNTGTLVNSPIWNPDGPYITP